jgi:hypothetical protein
MSACQSCGDKTYRELLDDNVRVRAERDEARAERDEARAELAFIAAEYEKANASDLTRDALAMQNAALKADVERVMHERDEARDELDFIKSEYGGADDEALTQDALVLKLRLRESELESESASRRMYERQHEDVWAALEKAGADTYHPEDGEPVVLWGVERLVKERDEARAEVAAAYRRGAEAMREAAAQEIERQVDALMLRAGLAADIRDLPVPEDKP